MRNGREDGKNLEMMQIEEKRLTDQKKKHWLILKNMKMHRKLLLKFLMISFCMKLNCV